MVESKKHIHFMGILGSGISYAASLAQLLGYHVSGCDRESSSEFLPELAEQHIHLDVGSSSAHLDQVDLVVISPAIRKLDPDSAELSYALTHTIPVITWQEFVGTYLLRDKIVIAIAGAHGKGTTSSLVGLMMEQAGLDPTVCVGALVPAWKKNFRFGSSRYVVIEADEYNDNYLHFNPDVVGITTIDLDHPEYFKNESNLLASFTKFISQIKPEVHGCLVLNGDDRLSNKLETTARVARYSFQDPKALVYGKNLEVSPHGVRFEVVYNQSKNLGTFEIPIYGAHNGYNVLCALAVLFTLKEPDDHLIQSARTALKNFRGVSRRFDIKGEFDGITIIDDYAHHPTEIAVTLQATRDKYPDKKIWAVFQPHTFSRTRLLFDNFVSALRNAPVDTVIVTDIFAAREKDTGEVSSKLLVAKIGSDRVQYKATLEETYSYLKENAQSTDVVIIMGAGDVNIITQKLMHG